MTIAQTRIPALPIEPLFFERWSARAFTGEEIPQDVLETLIEAARWAPSAYNGQPWRFLYARRSSPNFPTFLDLLNERNRQWAHAAGALLVIVSKKTITPPGKTEVWPSRSHSFDAGAAWSNFALQASRSGWSAHGIGGFDHEKARVVLNVPDDFNVEIAVAVGKRGDKSLLPETFQAAETPNGRLPLSEIAIDGGFPA